jgi:hypothetical protein
VRTHIVFAVILLVAIYECGCQSTGFLMGKPETYMLVPAAQPKTADYEMKMYFYESPDFEHEDMAYINISDTNVGWCVREILRVAREIGADGIIFTSKEYRPGWSAAQRDEYRSLTDAEKIMNFPKNGLSSTAFRFIVKAE